MSKMRTWRIVAVTLNGLADTLSEGLVGTAADIERLVEAALAARAYDVRHLEWDELVRGSYVYRGTAGLGEQP